MSPFEALRRRAVLVPVVVFLGASLGHVQQVHGATEDISFNRPESWAMKFFVAATAFSPIAPPQTRPPGSVGLGFESAWIPRLSDEQRRVAFDGTELEDLNKVPALGRPRLVVGLPDAFSLEVGWVPPITVNGARANLVDAALERPVLDRDRFTLGLRLFGQRGQVRGDITCSRSVASQPPGSPGNPKGCMAPSMDAASLNDVGLSLTGGVRLGREAALHLATGGVYQDPSFQVDALVDSLPDHTRLSTHGWTAWLSGGVGSSIGERVWLGGEGFYSPLLVRRSSTSSLGHDDFFTVRLLFRYRLR